MKIVGTGRHIHDAKEKATGYAKYAADIDLHGMAYVSTVRSSIPHGHVKHINADKALALPGVLGVFHCFNTPQKRLNHYRSQVFQDLPEEERVFTDHVRFIGDRVAAVAACDRETAEKAARLVEVEYEELFFTVGFDDTLEHAGICDEFSASIGEQLEKDGVEVQCGRELSRLHHAAMETHVCVADYDPFQKMLTIYSPNQAAFGIRTVIADYLEMPYHRVRVVKTVMGGSFGAKQEWFTEPAAALIAVKLGRPVKLVYSRAEAMTCTVVRGAMRGQMTGRFSLEGEILSLQADILLDAGAYIGNARDYVRTLFGKLVRTYKIPFVQYHARVISSNTPSSGAYRGWSAPEAAIFLEALMDKAADRLGIDRVALRIKNAISSGGVDPKSKLPYEEVRLIEALQRGEDRFDWNKRLAECREFNKKNTRYRRGIGVGCGGHGNTYYPRYNDYGEVRLSMNEDGTVQAAVSVHDHGCGTVTMVQMLVAESIGISMSDVTLQEADTAVTPLDYGCFSSRTTFVLGRAVVEAGRKMKEVILEYAAQMLSLPRESLKGENGCVYCVDDQETSLSYAEVAQEMILRLRRNVTVTEQYHNETNPGVVGVHFAFVEVDTWTGYTKVLDYLALQDVGQAINPAMCIAQTQGAAQMGCGAALREKMTVDAKGHCTDSLANYHVCLAPDMPDVQVELLTDGRSKEGPYGAKSIGEVCYVPAAPAVCSAVNHALSGEIEALPYDPDSILKYLAWRETK